MISDKTALSDAKRKLLEQYILGHIPPKIPTAGTITRRPEGHPAPLSLMQEQVWKRAAGAGAVPSFYNESITIHRIGDLDLEILERSFTEIIRRHEVWRTTFDMLQGEPVQVIHPAPSRVAVPFVDLRGIPEHLRQAETLRLATEHARQPFDLKAGPLVRALLVTLDEQNHQLFLTIHQSVVDGVSVYRIFPSELAALYAAFSEGRPSPLPDLQIQYADFAHWERNWLQGQIWAAQIAYWRQRLAGEFPSLNWPNTHSHSSTHTSRGAIQAFTVPQVILQRLRNLCHSEGVTLFMALLAGFTALLARYTEQKDLAIGTVAPAGRKHPEVQQLLGYFLNPIAIRMHLSGDLSVRDLLQQSRDTVLGALANDDIPWELLIKELNPELDESCPWQVPMAITLAPPVSDLGPGWQQTPMDVDSGWAKWGLYLELSERPEELIGRAQYNTDFFTSAAITKLLDDFKVALEGLAAADPSERVSALLSASTQGSIPVTRSASMEV